MYEKKLRVNYKTKKTEPFLALFNILFSCKNTFARNQFSLKIPPIFFFMLLKKYFSRYTRSARSKKKQKKSRLNCRLSFQNKSFILWRLLRHKLQTLRDSKQLQ